MSIGVAQYPALVTKGNPSRDLRPGLQSSMMHIVLIHWRAYSCPATRDCAPVSVRGHTK